MSDNEEVGPGPSARGAKPPDSKEKRWKLTIAYDGRPFSGWQSQPGGNTIQDRIEAALQTILASGNRIVLHGAGRTDAGVHAEGQAAHFATPQTARLTATQWCRALNAHLLPTIRIVACEAVAKDFHARFSAVRKTYRYEIFRGETLPPLRVGLAWHLRGPFDRGLFAEAGAILKGQHDFVAFAANRGRDAPAPLSTVRTLHGVCIDAHDEKQTVVRFTGDGFLYRMVRLMVGAMARCAQEKLSLKTLRNYVEYGNNAEKCRYCAPAGGLYLESVYYATDG